MHPSLLPYSPERDVYRLLNVPPNASMDEIAAACRHLARTFHPDRNGSARATQEMQIVNAVRQVMTDPSGRQHYDRERWRFHARRVQPADGPVRVSASVTGSPIGAPVAPAPWERYLVALRAGVKALLLELAPPRCQGCRAVVASGEDAFCAACGTPLLTGS